MWLLDHVYRQFVRVKNEVMQPLQVSLSRRQELEGNLILASTAANLFIKITQWDAHAWPIKNFFCIEFKGYKNIYAIKILHAIPVSQ